MKTDKSQKKKKRTYCMILFMYQSRNNVIVELEGRVAVPGLAAGWGRVGAAIPGSQETVFRDYSAERLDWGGGDARLCTWHTCTEPHVHTDAHTSACVTGGPRMSPLDWADVHFLVLLLHQSCLRCWRWRGGARRGSAGHFSARFFATSCESIIFPNKMSSFF